MAWALLALMFSQLALAGHSAFHVEHNISLETVHASSSHDCHGEHHNEGGGDQQNHDCPQCVLAQSLQSAFYNAPAGFVFFEKPSESFLTAKYSITLTYRNQDHFARAPPFILI